MLVTARRLTELKVADDELVAPAPVDRSPRRVSAPELVASADDALVALDGGWDTADRDTTGAPRAPSTADTPRWKAVRRIPLR